MLEAFALIVVGLIFSNAFRKRAPSPPPTRIIEIEIIHRRHRDPTPDPDPVAAKLRRQRIIDRLKQSQWDRATKRDDNRANRARTASSRPSPRSIQQE